MSKTESFPILNLQNAAVIGDKTEKASKPCPQILARRKLADISNLPQKPRLSIQEEKLRSIPKTTKEYIEQLQKDNVVLVKMLAQRNKIIEQSGIELERLRSNLIKMQEKNQQLALSHTQMLAELNSGKDRLKTLQHELGCKNGLLKARKLDNEEKASARLHQHEDDEVNVTKLQEKAELPKEGTYEEKPRNVRKRTRSQSLGSSETLQLEGNAGNKRSVTRRQSARFKAAESKTDEDLYDTDDAKFLKIPLSHEPVLENGSTSVDVSVKIEDDNRSRSVTRRQSARFKAGESKNDEDLFDMDDAKFPNIPLSHEPVLENGSTSLDVSVKIEDDNRSSSDIRCESQEFGRSSLCRPSRLAAKKVQSYKEIPVNVKMRRS